MNLMLHPQLGGQDGVRQTLETMAGLAQAAKLDPLIRDQAAYAIAGCGKGDTTCQSYALLAWVNRTVRYVADPAGVEALSDPRLLAVRVRDHGQAYGDCGHLSTYLATLLLSIGHRPAFRAVGYNGHPYQHVYVLDGGLTLDPTRDAWTVTLRPYRETMVMTREL